MSKTISIVCVICSWQSSDPSAQIGITSIDMLCQLASNSLCPSKRLDIPALPLQGSSFKKGVRFSVHTTSLGKVPCSRCRFDSVEFACPAGWKDITGRVVRVESMKFSEAQNRPDSAFVKVNHRPSALSSFSLIFQNRADIVLFISLRFHPCPELHTSSSFPRTTPRSSTPAFGIPSSQAKPQMQLPSIRML
jgi:hypothetical protein